MHSYVRALSLYATRSKYNLNAMSHDTAIALIRGLLAQGVNVTEVRPHQTLRQAHNMLYRHIWTLLATRAATRAS